MSLDRNDVPAALARFEKEWKATKGEPSPDLCQTLIMLQDDPAEYLAAVRAFVAKQ
jgi:hypothetical protein